ncbi:MAG: hypothetical protein V4529_17340 [Gemmatimonadota bacterium]
MIGVVHAPGHGSYRLYKQGCHCSECRAAQNAVIRSYRSRKRELMRQDELHAVARLIQQGIWNGTDALSIAAEVIALGVKR